MKESEIYRKWCWDNDIIIYPIPIVYNGDRCKIAIKEKGFEKIGSEVYEGKETKKKLQIETETGFKEIIQIIPPLHQKIADLYKQIYIKHHEKRNNEIPIDTSAAG